MSFLEILRLQYFLIYSRHYLLQNHEITQLFFHGTEDYSFSIPLFARESLKKLVSHVFAHP